MSFKGWRTPGGPKEGPHVKTRMIVRDSAIHIHRDWSPRPGDMSRSINHGVATDWMQGRIAAGKKPGKNQRAEE